LAGKDAVTTRIYTVQPAVGGVAFQPAPAPPPVAPVNLPTRKLSLTPLSSVFRCSLRSASHGSSSNTRAVGLATLPARLLSGSSLAPGCAAVPWVP
jgi:hypothetical protein